MLEAYVYDLFGYGRCYDGSLQPTKHEPRRGAVRNVAFMCGAMIMLLTLGGRIAIAELVEGNGGDNDLRGTNERDTIRAFDGYDTVRGLRRADEIRGGRGQDDLYGNRGSDTIWAGRGSDEVWGGGGNDVIHTEGDNRVGSTNSDFIDCGLGNDTVYLDSGTDAPEGFRPPDAFLLNCETTSSRTRP